MARIALIVLVAAIAAFPLRCFAAVVTFVPGVPQLNASTVGDLRVDVAITRCTTVEMDLRGVRGASEWPIPVGVAASATVVHRFNPREAVTFRLSAISPAGMIPTLRAQYQVKI